MSIFLRFVHPCIILILEGRFQWNLLWIFIDPGGWWPLTFSSHYQVEISPLEKSHIQWERFWCKMLSTSIIPQGHAHWTVTAPQLSRAVRFCVYIFYSNWISWMVFHLLTDNVAVYPYHYSFFQSTCQKNRVSTINTIDLAKWTHQCK